MNKKKDSLIICRCEEVTEKEIRKAIREGADNINAIKRMTRAGMGLCQGKTCTRLISRIISKKTGKLIEEIKPGTFRPPARPIPARVMSNIGNEIL